MLDIFIALPLIVIGAGMHFLAAPFIFGLVVAALTAEFSIEPSMPNLSPVHT
jgi:hypothetical protein